jgi:hypothetical protein
VVLVGGGVVNAISACKLVPLFAVPDTVFLGAVACLGGEPLPHLKVAEIVDVIVGVAITVAIAGCGGIRNQYNGDGVMIVVNGIP